MANKVKLGREPIDWLDRNRALTNRMPMEEKNDRMVWDIRREGRSWTPEEFTARTGRLLGVDLEVSGGKLFGSEETRRLILGMLLENVGMDAVVRLGDLSRWKEAIAAVERERDAG